MRGTQTRGSVSICKLYSHSQSYRQYTLWLKLSEIDTVDSSTNTEFVKRADTAFSTSVIAIWPLPEVIPSNHLGTIFFSPSLSIFKETQRKSLQMTQRSSLLHPARLRSRPICACTPPHNWKIEQLLPMSLGISRVLSISAVALGE